MVAPGAGHDTDEGGERRDAEHEEDLVPEAAQLPQGGVLAVQHGAGEEVLEGGLYCTNYRFVSFAEAKEVSIGQKAVGLHWPVLPDCWRSVELAGIPIGICTVGTLTALPDYLLTLLAFSDAQQVQQQGGS